jgi:hypothetical protein
MASDQAASKILLPIIVSGFVGINTIAVAQSSLSQQQLFEENQQLGKTDQMNSDMQEQLKDIKKQSDEDDRAKRQADEIRKSVVPPAGFH